MQLWSHPHPVVAAPFTASAAAAAMHLLSLCQPVGFKDTMDMVSHALLSHSNPAVPAASAAAAAMNLLPCISACWLQGHHGHGQHAQERRPGQLGALLHGEHAAVTRGAVTRGTVKRAMELRLIGGFIPSSVCTAQRMHRGAA
jgi:hypothetical protein